MTAEEQANISVLYSANAEVAAQFWTWRHRILNAFFTAVAAAIAMASWFYKHPDLHAWVFVPFMLAAIFSVLSDSMDRVNTKVLRECYRVGTKLEEQLANEGGIFKAIQDAHHTRMTYHRLLRWLYLGSALAFSIVALSLAILID
jgi:hypothetical protein